MTPQQKINQYKAMHNKLPPVSWLAVASKISISDAEDLLAQGELFNEQERESIKSLEVVTPPISPIIKKMDRSDIPDTTKGKDIQQAEPVSSERVERRAKVETPSHNGLIDRALLWFANALQKIAFIVVALADFVIECLFYSTFGPNELTKIVLASWGFVIVGAKLWAWSSGKRGLAIFCSLLSIIGATGIFNASMDAQAHVAATSNAVIIDDPRLSIQQQIKGIEANIEQMTNERGKLADGSNPNQVLDYNNQINAANAQLPKLRTELASIRQSDIKPIELQLDAWSIFDQVSKKIGISPQAFAFIFILLVSILIQWIIGATTPRKKPTNREGVQLVGQEKC